MVQFSVGGVRYSTWDVCSVCLYNSYMKPFATNFFLKLLSTHKQLSQIIINLRRLPKKFCNTIFIARNLLYNSYNSLNIGKIDGCITHLIFLHYLHHLQKTCTSKKQQHLPPYCTSLHFLFAATTSLPQEPCHHSPTSLQMDSKWWKAAAAISGLNGGWRRTVHLN